MCMLFIKPKNLLLPENYHLSLVEHNRDGVSIYNLSCGELVKFLDNNLAYQYITDNFKDELVIHYRFGTSGKKSFDQLHGFEIVNRKYNLFHNGVLSTFKGDSDLSDTQQLINMFNNDNFELHEIISYLEQYETSSRFLIVNNETNEVIKPKCAKWNDATMINDHKVYFSNTYAIDYDLLFDDKYSKYDQYDNFDFFDDIDSEIEYTIQTLDEKDLSDYVLNNSELIAQYLKNYFG